MSKLNKSLIFLRAWHAHKIMIKHNCFSSFIEQLRDQYRIAKLIGYKNYKITHIEQHYLNQ